MIIFETKSIMNNYHLPQYLLFMSLKNAKLIFAGGGISFLLQH